MKTRSKLLLVLGFLSAILLGYVLGVIVDFPSPEKQEVAGTVGKANKYRKTVLTAGDVKLRSDLLQDTARLRTLIQGLTYFSLMTEETSQNLNLVLVKFRSNGMGADELQEKQLGLLENFSDFLKNGNKNLGATITLLSGLLLEGEAAETPDVEKNLRDFSNFVDGLDKWGTVFGQGLQDLDQFLLSSELLANQPASLKELKSLRDQLVISGLQLGTMANSNGMVQGTVFAMEARDQLGYIQAQENLNLSVFASDQLNLLARPNAALDNAIAYNSQEQLFVVLSQEKLAAGALPRELQVIALVGDGSLNVSLPPMQMSDLIGSATLGGLLNSQQINLVFSSQVGGLINAQQAVSSLGSVL
ncbi:MAG: hypothetical protein R6V75_00450 [Bacteroidales bacterium]